MSNSAILTITGSDSTGGSGVQADITAISALGSKAVSVITSVTLQNTLGIQHFYDLPAPIVSGQLDAIVDDVMPETVKIGMVRNTEVLKAIVSALRRYKPKSVVYAPVLFSSHGDRLMGTETIEMIHHKLFPLCKVIIMRRHLATQVAGLDVLAVVAHVGDVQHIFWVCLDGEVAFLIGDGGVGGADVDARHG